MSLFFQFIGNKVYVGNESYNFSDSVENKNYSLQDCEENTKILNKIINSHFKSFNKNKKLFAIKSVAHKILPDNTLFLKISSADNRLFAKSFIKSAFEWVCWTFLTPAHSNLCGVTR